MKETKEWVTIGKVVAPFGIYGELKVRSFTDIPDRFVTLDVVHLSPGYISYAIEGVRPHKGGDMQLLKLRGIDDATAAETVRGSDICVPLSTLPQLPPDSYYQHDIVGLQVFNLDGRLIGVIEDIMVTGGNDVYVIKNPKGKQILVPAIKDVVKQIDLIRQVMYIDPIKGLLDDDAVVDDPTE
jgi:16S rRNA processing protein RimM